MRDLADELPHLQAPIAQMYVARDGPAIGTEQALQTVADHRGAQMTNMHGLGDIGAAIQKRDDFIALIPPFPLVQ